jgi:hypothetical protein
MAARLVFGAISVSNSSDLPTIAASVKINPFGARAIAHETACLDGPAGVVDCRQSISGRQGGKLSALYRKQRSASGQECANPLPCEHRHSRFDFIWSAYVPGHQTQAACTRRNLHLCYFGLDIGAPWIEKKTYGFSGGRDFAQDFKPFGNQFPGEECRACDIAARAVEARNKTDRNRVASDGKHDRNRIGGGFCREGSPGTAARGNDHGDPTTNQVGGELWQPFVFSVRPAI